MKLACFGCGVEKDTDVLETCVHEGAGLIDDRPVPPLYVVDCQPPRGGGDREYRVIVVCHACMARLDLDMWTCAEHWAQIDPVVPFDRLPRLRDDDRRSDPTTYAPLP